MIDLIKSSTRQLQIVSASLPFFFTQSLALIFTTFQQDFPRDLPYNDSRDDIQVIQSSNSFKQIIASYLTFVIAERGAVKDNDIKAAFPEKRNITGG